MKTRDPLLRMEDVHTYYGNIHALKGVSFKMSEGEIATLIGSNGAGKTTLLNTISGILKCRRGAVYFDGRAIQGLSAHRVVAAGISHVPEGRKIFSRLTVMENLEMGAFLRRDSREVREDAASVFERFPGLTGRRNQVAGTLSGGEQQMLAIGRALMARPRLLLLDEPSMGLAPLVVETIFETIQTINRAGTTILLVEQNALMAFQIATKGYVMQTGEIMLEDGTEELRHNEMVLKLYLGGE